MPANSSVSWMYRSHEKKTCPASLLSPLRIGTKQLLNEIKKADCIGKEHVLRISLSQGRLPYTRPGLMEWDATSPHRYLELVAARPARNSLARQGEGGQPTLPKPTALDSPVDLDRAVHGGERFANVTMYDGRLGSSWRFCSTFQVGTLATERMSRR
ncbi:hypothetical protein VTK73DRAFT_8391 [Phialemonium thermophilum]|uniref:Uncharacterized protein n=1 Tax=Phialemonium thermophilum TaxID=223376 RepID=A0ABR3W921_9PEZI